MNLTNGLVAKLATLAVTLIGQTVALAEPTAPDARASVAAAPVASPAPATERFGSDEPGIMPLSVSPNGRCYLG